MKLFLNIPDNIYLKIIEGKAEKRIMMTAIKSGQTLPENSRLLSESEILTALNDLKVSDEVSRYANRIYGVKLATDAVKRCKAIGEENYD